jgi:hypothetical protein
MMAVKWTGFLGSSLTTQMSWKSIAAVNLIAHLWERLDLSPMTGGTLPREEAKGAMARRFVLDDRRPTSVVSQGTYLIIRTDLTMAGKKRVIIFSNVLPGHIPHFG